MNYKQTAHQSKGPTRTTHLVKARAALITYKNRRNFLLDIPGRDYEQRIA